LKRSFCNGACFSKNPRRDLVIIWEEAEKEGANEGNIEEVSNSSQGLKNVQFLFG
jgi:hypothetical protein